MQHTPALSISEQLLKEMAKTTEANSTLTKGEALIKNMVNQALQGDQRMIASIVKYYDQPDDPQNHQVPLTQNDHEIILRYFAKNKDKLEQELAKNQAPGLMYDI